MRKEVQRYVKECEICQRQKYESISPACLLKPLEIPDRVWEDASMDFIDGLPKSQGKSVIMVLVDKPPSHLYEIVNICPTDLLECCRNLMQFWWFITLDPSFMDVLSCPFCCFRALLFHIIWLVISISTIGDSGPLILSTKKECSYPEIIGRVPCSQNNLMASYFDTGKSTSDLDFSDLLNQQDCSEGLHKVLIDNNEIFGLSSLQRHLIGEGSHRKLVTTMAFYNHPKFAHFVNKHFCEAVIVEYLPTGIFSDPFELQHLVRRKVFRGAAVFGDTNLELPSALSNTSLVEIHFSIKSDAPKVVVQLPLHARYPPLDSSGYANIKILEPDLFFRCGSKEGSETDTCFWVLIDLGLSNGSSVRTWRIPCGNEEHTVAVTFVTYLSALICSLLIVLSSTVISRKESKVE